VAEQRQPTSAREPSGPAAGGTLYVVATPIGNLADVTLRSLDVLRAVPLVAAEDTRLARRLFTRHGVETRLVSYHARNAAARERELIEHLHGGRDLALVTDAGTPGVSDPGAELAGAWAAQGGAVVPIPGASAVLAALVASGFVAPRWSFEGFLPRRGGERTQRLARIAADERPTVLFESPGRTVGTLMDLAAVCGGDRPAAVARELTKLHEEVWRGTLESVAHRAVEQGVRGEVTIVVGPGTRAASEPSVSLSEAMRRVDARVAAGETRSGAARAVARETGHDRRALYRAVSGRS
jgi:16S rRNA (cytidine1402-2'-O)-methyltransferase